jgi:hypothetical protein
VVLVYSGPAAGKSSSPRYILHAVRDIIPEPVFERLQRHLITVGNAAESGWESGSAEEDTLTGHLGAQLQRSWSHAVTVSDRRWRWRIRYKKFRGRGRGAFEKESGADGIVQIEIDDAGVLITKALLFQAKKGDSRRDSRLADQVEKMESLADHASAVFEYRATGYTAISGAALLRSVAADAIASRDEVRQPLGSYLGETYLECRSGLRGMYFDAIRQLLIVPTKGSTRAIPVEVGHRVTIEVQAR